MLKNYLLIAFRNLKKNKIFSFINILGLATGTTACLLILQYVLFENSYDQFHLKKENIYRITSTRSPQGQDPIRSAFTYAPLASALKQDLPEVVATTRLAPPFGYPIFSAGNVHGTGEKWLFADQGMFTMFSFTLLRGNPATALSKPYQMVLTESLARKYFGKENPIGKSIHLKDLSTDKAYEITGIMADVPAHSHLQFGALASFETMRRIDDNLDKEWNWNNFYTYVELSPATNTQATENKLTAILSKYKRSETKEPLQEDLHLQKLADIHLRSSLQGEVSVNGNYKMVYIMLIIALFIIVIAWLNYINLSTAKYAERAKEIGVRKVTGASRPQLIRQFLTETCGLQLISTIIALTLFQVLLPAFRQLTGAPVPSLFQSGFTIWLIAAFCIAAGTLLAGFYPAFVLSSFHPLQVLKGKLSHTSGVTLRKVLVVFQFAASVILIIGTCVVLLQVRHMKEQNLGINMEQVLIVKGPSALPSWRETYEKGFAQFTSRLANYPAVNHFSAASFIPGSFQNSASIRPVNTTAEQAKEFRLGFIDRQYIQTYGLTLVAGTNFPEQPSPTLSSVLINETAARQLGFESAEKAAGQKIIGSEFINNGNAQIVGVIQDFHYSSLKDLIEPCIFYFDKSSPYYYSFKIHTSNISATIAYIEEQYKKAYAGNPFTYFFLDEAFNTQYIQEVQFGKMVAVFSGLAIFIACLGLLGLSYFSTTVRTKEIGIRKVLGASVSNIMLLLSGDFIKLILLATLIAWPVAYMSMYLWLQNYAFRIDINVWILLLPSIIVIVIALLTISIQTIRTARENPVKALRYE